MTENTALLLDACGVLTLYRGETFVKGPGYIKTYFVPLDENFNLIKKEHSSEYYNSLSDRKRYYSVRDDSSDVSYETVPNATQFTVHNRSYFVPESTQVHDDKYSEVSEDETLDDETHGEDQSDSDEVFIEDCDVSDVSSLSTVTSDSSESSDTTSEPKIIETKC